MRRENESLNQWKLRIVKMWEDKTGYAFLGDIDDPDHFWAIYDEVMGTYVGDYE